MSSFEYYEGCGTVVTKLSIVGWLLVLQPAFYICLLRASDEIGWTITCVTVQVSCRSAIQLDDDVTDGLSCFSTTLDRLEPDTRKWYLFLRSWNLPPTKLDERFKLLPLKLPTKKFHLELIMKFRVGVMPKYPCGFGGLTRPARLWLSLRSPQPRGLVSQTTTIMNNEDLDNTTTVLHSARYRFPPPETHSPPPGQFSPPWFWCIMNRPIINPYREFLLEHADKCKAFLKEFRSYAEARKFGESRWKIKKLAKDSESYGPS